MGPGSFDPLVQRRKQTPIDQAQIVLDAIRSLAGPGVVDPPTDPRTLTRGVTTGIMDAPHLRENPFARGEIEARINVHGACASLDTATGKTLAEQERSARLFASR